jgi:hypothetical protein
VLLAFDILALIPLGAIMAFRAFRFAQRNMLWSPRNRLLFVYGLFGVLAVNRNGCLVRADRSHITAMARRLYLRVASDADK